MSGVIHELILPYSPESNGIAEHFTQTINMIARSITTTDPDIPCLGAEAVNMVAYPKKRLPYKYRPSSIIPFEGIYSKQPTIS
jgi:hypothetical protein